MKKIKIAIALLMFTSAILVVSCKKSSDNTPATAADTDVSGATDNTLAENTSNDAVEIGAEATDNGSLNNYRMGNNEENLSACASIVLDTTNRTVTVTFNGGVCMDGRTRSGSIIYNFSGSPRGAHYRTPGFTYTTTSNNYVVDSNQVSISHVVLNTTPAGFDSSVTDETWSISGGIGITKPNGNTITWSCTRVKTLLNTKAVYNGPNIPITWSQARVGLTGEASGSRSVNGETFSVVVTNQLVRDFGSCRILGRVPFIIGTLTFTESTKKYPRYIDYGAGAPGSGNYGDCDLWASVTINGIVYNILLP